MEKTQAVQVDQSQFLLSPHGISIAAITPMSSYIFKEERSSGGVAMASMSIGSNTIP